MINKILLKDSLHTSVIKNYTDTITKYIDGKNFTIDGKKISSNELVNFVNQANSENDKIKDSLQISKILIELTKKQYQIPYIIKRNRGSTTLEIPTNKVDSALILFPHYRHKLSIKDGDWVIIGEKEAYKNPKHSQ